MSPKLANELTGMLAFATLGGSLWAWGRMLVRGPGEPPLLPYTPRRPVPWQGVDVVLLFFLYLGLMAAFSLLARRAVGAELSRPIPRAVEGRESTVEAVNPLQDLAGDRQPWAVGIALLMAVVVAPIVEEFLFRALLQGWLEKTWRRLRRRSITFRKNSKSTLLPIVTASFVFAIIHYQAGTPDRYRTEFLAAQFIALALAGLVTLGVAIAWLRVSTGATAADLGWEPRKLPGDIGRGLLMFVAVVPPLLGLQAAMMLAMRHFQVEGAVSPVPVPLFFFALALGTLYQRSHRLASSVILHMGLNLASMLLLLLGSK